MPAAEDQLAQRSGDDQISTPGNSRRCCDAVRYVGAAFQSPQLPCRNRSAPDILRPATGKVHPDTLSERADGVSGNCGQLVRFVVFDHGQKSQCYHRRRIQLLRFSGVWSIFLLANVLDECTAVLSTSVPVSLHQLLHPYHHFPHAGRPFFRNNADSERVHVVATPGFPNWFRHRNRCISLHLPTQQPRDCHNLHVQLLR